MEIYFGVVEDINDPEEAGRVRIRIFGVHSEKLAEVPTDALPWAQCMVGSYDASLGGKGKSPTGIAVGQLVVCTFVDKLMQVPMVLGALNGINSDINNFILGAKVSRNDSVYGFKQPVSDDYVGQPDTNFQARSNEVNPIHDARSGSQITGVPDSKGGQWDEPASTMSDSTYPNSKVYETESGHLQEFDDTPGNERILTYHKGGTFKEISNDHQIAKIIGDGYEIVTGDKKLLVRGELSITVEGDSKIYTKGETYVKSDSKTTVESPEIDLGTDSPEPMVMGDKLADWISNELKVQFDSHTHMGNLGIVTSPPIAPLIEGTALKGNIVYSTKNKTQR